MATELERYKEAVKVAIFGLRSLGLNYAHLAHAIEERINEALNPPPEYEEVAVERWGIFNEKGDSLAYYDIKDAGAKEWPEHALVKLTGTLKRPKPQKVAKSVSVRALLKPNGEPVPVKDDRQYPFHEVQGNFPPMTGGELTFTWTE